MLNRTVAVLFATLASSILGFAFSVLFYSGGVGGMPWVLAAYFLTSIGAIFGLCTALVVCAIDNGSTHGFKDYVGFGIAVSMVFHALAVVLDWQQSSPHIVENLIAALLTGTVIGLGYGFGRWASAALQRKS